MKLSFLASIVLKDWRTLRRVVTETKPCRGESDFIPSCLPNAFDLVGWIHRAAGGRPVTAGLHFELRTEGRNFATSRRANRIKQHRWQIKRASFLDNGIERNPFVVSINFAQSEKKEGVATSRWAYQIKQHERQIEGIRGTTLSEMQIFSLRFNLGPFDDDSSTHAQYKHFDDDSDSLTHSFIPSIDLSAEICRPWTWRTSCCTKNTNRRNRNDFQSQTRVAHGRLMNAIVFCGAVDRAYGTEVSGGNCYHGRVRWW